MPKYRTVEQLADDRAAMEAELAGLDNERDPLPPPRVEDLHGIPIYDKAFSSQTYESYTNNRGTRKGRTLWRTGSYTFECQECGVVFTRRVNTNLFENRLCGSNCAEIALETFEESNQRLADAIEKLAKDPHSMKPQALRDLLASTGYPSTKSQYDLLDYRTQRDAHRETLDRFAIAVEQLESGNETSQGAAWKALQKLAESHANPEYKTVDD